MPTDLLGKPVAEEIYRKVVLDLSLLSFVPKLVVVLVGEDPASQTYVRSKEKKCLDLGMHGETLTLPVTVTEDELLAVVRKLNADPTVTGILVQLPLPPAIRKRAVLKEIHPLKDVDGLHAENAGLLFQGEPRLQPCTPAGVMEILRHYGIPTVGKHAVVLGRSDIVGRPMATMLTLADATVTVCHSKTADLACFTRDADILVAAIGKPKFLKADHVKPGATVVDVGIHRTPTGLCGDVDAASVKTVCGALTPVPGGVGPMTIAMLMKNVLMAASLQSKGR
ncbi:bifunctional 5,10-methylenetetrahydrofolate dehydrogenase/5,10-methenyltetrahydrofolate cyclohydrolase [bacterium]|nr:bifunctional 5,10-methylenetetrahydrofolate dehydrogenase/5,10-methenyltetrahydrofolate cyclohydrolase [bacterium]